MLVMARSRSFRVRRWAAWSALALGCSYRTDFFDPVPPGTAGTGAENGVAGSGAARGGATGAGGATGGGTGVSGGGGSGGSTSGTTGSGAAAGSDHVAGRGGAAGSSQGGTAGSDPGDAGDGAAGDLAVGLGGDSASGGTGGTSDAGSAGDHSAGEAGSGPEPCVPSPERCDGISNDCDEAVDEDACPAGCSARQRDGHVYLLCLIAEQSNYVNYATAAAGCRDAGGVLGLDRSFELARIESAPENAFVKEWIIGSAGQAGMVWFGANDLDQEHRWVFGRGENAVQFFSGAQQGGGTPYQGAFHDFAEGRPNAANGADEDCAGYDADFAWQWNDLVCSQGRLGFVCEAF